MIGSAYGRDADLRAVATAALNATFAGTFTRLFWTVESSAGVSSIGLSAAIAVAGTLTTTSNATALAKKAFFVMFIPQ